MDTVNKGAKPNAHTNKWRHELQGPNTAKRGRAPGGTPPDAVQSSKKQMHDRNTDLPSTSTAAPSIAKVVIVNNLCVAVYDSPATDVILPMDKVKYNLLYESITNLLFSEIAKSSVVPTFGENKLARGVMKVICTTPGAKSWLSDMIQRIPPLWPNMKLKMVDFDKLPQQTRVLGLFTNCKLNVVQIRQMLAAMNPHISVGCWTVLNSKTSESGVHIAFGVDRLQLDMLRASNFKLHFGVGYASFKDISKKEGEPQQNNAVESEMEVQSTDVDLNDDDDEDNITVIVNSNGNGQSAASSTNAPVTANPIAGTNATANANSTIPTVNTAMQNQNSSASSVSNSDLPMEIEPSIQHSAA